MNHNSFIAQKELFDSLAAHGETFVCTENQTLFRQGERPSGLYLVQGGEAALMLLSPGGNILYSFPALAGSVLGLPAVIEDVPYTLSAIARKGSQIAVVESGSFRELLGRKPHLYPSVLSILASEVRAARNALAGLRGSSGLKPESHCMLTEVVLATA